MEIGSLLLGAALLILVGLFLARPFLLANARYGTQRSMRQELLTQKEAILAQIQALEFDFETGTIPELDYKQQRRQFVAEAAEILKKLDELPANTSPLRDKTDKEIEAAVARLRRRPSRPMQSTHVQPQPAAALQASAGPTSEQHSPTSTAAEVTAPTNGRINFCSQCGKQVEKADNFCAYCGHKIHHSQPS